MMEQIKLVLETVQGCAQLCLLYLEGKCVVPTIKLLFLNPHLKLRTVVILRTRQLLLTVYIVIEPIIACHRLCCKEVMLRFLYDSFANLLCIILLSCLSSAL